MKGIEWRHLIGLHELYLTGQTRLKIHTNSFVKQVVMKQRKLVKFKVGSRDILVITPKYKAVYEKEFHSYYAYYSNFFNESGLENNARKAFTEEDLKGLMFVYYNRDELRGKLTTETRFSAFVFKNQNSKYLSNKPSLRDAMLDILGVASFPDKEPKNNQWRLVVDCQNPVVIVLCENLDCLKVPMEYKDNNIELWYVGGNNTAPLLNISQEKLQLPIFYLCDWDYAGLSIYSRVKKIIEEKGAPLTLITPPHDIKTLPVGVKHHKSKWKTKPFSGLLKKDFHAEQIIFIEKLISNDIWVEEQNIDLVEVLKNRNFLNQDSA
ncbi:hypothetical protein AAEO56_06455 [Flavobacterium sp. DGU11]|uniref:Wadjet protein JetD C-terminal domain-containing protein n=1 Tax=Flavobacterium arundinis TaxID=3139143 RepID=A0ABU9HUX2_9FLAO